MSDIAETFTTDNMPMIYLDYNATTPIAPEVADAMRHYLTGGWGNPSSAHALGREAKAAIERARGQVAALIGAKPAEIVFTSGGTEASNTAIKGIAYQQPVPIPIAYRRRHVITSAVEHPATLEACRFLERQDWRITRVPVDSTGLVDPDDVRRMIIPETVLITIMHAQNEVGTIEPIAEISRIAREHAIPFHTDAAQSLGKIPVDVNELGVDFLSLAGHKLYAPKGVGALYVRDGLQFEPFMHGAGHESGRRAGTESALLIVGLGAACDLAIRRLADGGESRIRALRDRLHEGLAAAFGDRVVLNGHPERRLPNTLNMSFAGHVGADLLAKLPDLCASTSSACHSGEHRPSPVLTAMGLPPERALGAIRFSLGRSTTAGELDEVITAMRSAVAGRP